MPKIKDVVMVPVHSHITKQQHEGLKFLQSCRGKSISEMIRIALDDWLIKENNKIKMLFTQDDWKKIRDEKVRTGESETTIIHKAIQGYFNRIKV